PAEWAWGRGMQDRLAPPIAARWALRGGYQADFTGLADPALPYMAAAVLAAQDTALGVRLLRLANVGYVVTVQQRFAPLPEVARFESVFDRPVRVLRVPEPLPAAFVVGGARHAVTTEEALLAIARHDFEPTREAVLSSPGDGRDAPRGFRGSAVLALRTPDRLLVGTEASAPGWLVVVEAHAPGWEASVDGAPAPVLRANALFRAVPIPAGRHDVEMRYRPPSAPWGAVTSAIGVALIAAALAAARRDPAPAAT
ncbi:MAG TPA: YfhO family protein, partial [Vicinamibacteria bacterium]|nr:YfhO family protein [Vicinamibacteria bacterium]